MAATHANQVSSRSHAILQFIIISKAYTTKLTLVDLAGSERASVSDNRGLRM
jgi:kinesin family protein 18/19